MTSDPFASTWTTKTGESQQAFTIYSSSTITQRKYKGPSSLQAFAQWLHLNCHVLENDLSEHFRQGSRHSEDIDILPFLSMPALGPDWGDYVAAYLDEIAPIYPIVGKASITRAGTYLARFNALELNPISDRPTMACVYACIALGARTKGHTGVAQAYIEAACSLIGYLSSLPYLESAQALLLIAVDQRGREKTGAAFLLVRQAIGILNSMGLHRTPFYSNDQLSVARQQMDRRIWHTAHALEKTMALEEGRPSSTYDRMFDDASSSPGTIGGCLEPWKAFVSLGVIQGQISERFFDQRSWAVSPDHAELLALQGELDECLTQWSDNLPKSLRPCRGLVNCPQELLAFRTGLSFHFHYALIALHRTALIGDVTKSTTTTRAFDSAARTARCLQTSEGICANSARDILTTYLQFIEQKQPSPLVTLSQPLLAVYVLTIYILKHPDAWSTEADLQLLSSGAKAVEEAYECHGLPVGFSSMLSALSQAAISPTKSLYEGPA
ncbi:hypothetical protein D6C97_04597 [Aureobasidium pullulans]|nr:hypothetical protein D6C97_04597 [Aureobasidium pullulans]